MRNRYTLIIILILGFLNIKNYAQPFSGGSGSKADPYLIETPAQLDSVRNYLSSHFILSNNIDLSAYTNWEPIGNNTNKFTGSFDGNNYQINNLNINNPTSNSQGLFSYFQPTTAKDSIKNLKLSNVAIHAYDSSGAVVAKMYNGTIYNCSVEGTIQGNQRFASFAGYISSSVVKQCNANVTLAGNGRIGGLVGWLTSSAISKCYCLGTITVEGSEVGGIAYFADNSSCSVQECFSDMVLTANNSIGGIIYGANYATIKNCYSLSDLNGYGQVGGILSYGYNCKIQYCYSTGSIFGHQSGGIGSNNWGPSEVFQNCLAVNAEINEREPSEYIGRIYGSETNTMRNHYAWDSIYVNEEIITDGTHNNSNGQNVSFSEIKDSLFYKNASNWSTAAWDFTNVWTMDTTNVSPFPILKGISADVQKNKHSQAIIWNQQLAGGLGASIELKAAGGHYPAVFSVENDDIATVNGNTLLLKSLGATYITAYIPGDEFFNEVSETRELVVYSQGDGSRKNPFAIRDIDELKSISKNMSAHYILIADIDLSSEENWEPIGGTCHEEGECSYEYFKGSFDGNGYTISNMQINRPDESYIGLFGNFRPSVPGDSIKNLTLTNVNITGYGSVGAVVGRSEDASVINCNVSGAIKCFYDDAGGLVGEANSSMFENCSNASDVNSTEGYAGGIAGGLYSGSMIDCYSTGDISGKGYIGGIAGYASESTISSCSNKGNIKSTGSYSGGLFGEIYQNCNITNSYNIGDVSGIDYAGGIAGEIYNDSHISKSFNTGNIIGMEYLGGIAGYIGSNSSINQCYTVGSFFTNSGSSGIGGVVGYASGSVVSESYCTGKVLGLQELGGIVGYADNSTIKSTVAINAVITEGTNVGRISGVNSSSTFSDNYAWQDMYVGGTIIETGTTDNNNGFNTPFNMLCSESFYTNSLLFTEKAWNFDTTWVMNPEISPYPILKNLNINDQKVKHAQSITWLQNIATPVGDTLKLTAVGGKTGAAIVYSSFEPLVAHIIYDTLFVNTLGAARIMAYVDGNEFFAADSIIKPMVNYSTTGTAEDPYLIYNAAELDAVRCDQNAYYKLMNNINLSSFSNWEPIGNANNEFYGSFDGNNKTVTNLTINRPNEFFIGLFGAVNEAPGVGGDKSAKAKEKSTLGVIKDLYIQNANISGKGYVGILAGSISTTDSIKNVHTSGNVNGSSYGVGGIAGNLSFSSIENCSSNGDVIANEGIGGLIGYSENSILTNCYFKGAANGETYEVGGISGGAYQSTFENCFSSGSVYAYNQAGGIAGYMYDCSISNSYSSADIMVLKDYAGGIVASMDKSSVTNCYSTGFVNSETAWSVGGIVGKTHAWRTDYNTLKNNVAISAKINGQLNNSNRIVGYSYGNITLSNNYAWKDLYVSDSKITNGTHDNKNGQNVTLDGVKSEAFYTYAANWDTEPWDFTNTWEINASVSPYPILKNIPADAQKVKHSQVMTTPWEQELPSNAKVLDEVVLVAIADGPSGLVSFSSEDSTVASLSGNILTAQTVGESAIHAFYPETEFYKASNSFSNLIMVTQKLDQTISWDQVLSMIYGDNMNLTATASSGLDIEYVISDESVASVSGNTLTAKGVGYTMITATQPGNNSYNAAENQKVVDLNVSPMQLMIGGEFSVSNKEYDGTKSATISENNLILLTPLSGDDVNLTGIVVEFTDSITGNNKEVHIVEAQLDGADKSNYILTLGSAPSTVASITAVTGINENLFAGIKIYPNPFCEYINMESNDNIECITVTNVLGQNVMNMNLKGQKTISTSHLDTGIYFISVKTQDGQSATFRMIKR